MSSSITNACLKLLEDKDFKINLKLFFKPLIDLLLYEIYPYLYIICVFTIICFLLILAILIILLQYKHFSII